MTAIFRLGLGVLGIFLLTAQHAFAHHPMGGKAPSTFFEGLLSGLAHPVIGVDHLIFTVGVGVAAMIVGRLLQLPLMFIGLTIVGALVHKAGINLPGAEVIILLSVLVVGTLLALKPTLGAGVWAGLFAAAGLFHGYAYGEAIVGSETAPLLAYLLGFAAIQYSIAVASGWAAQTLMTSREVAARVGGGVLVGAAVALSGGPLAFLAN